MGHVTLHNAADVVRYHKPTAEQIDKHELLAGAAERFIRAVLIADGGAKPHLEPRVKAAESDFLRTIENCCPDSNDKEMALALAKDAIGLALFIDPRISSERDEDIDPNNWEWLPQRVDLVIKWIRAAKMWASAAVALNGAI